MLLLPLYVEWVASTYSTGDSELTARPQHAEVGCNL
jgi:hypothetical protein